MSRLDFIKNVFMSIFSFQFFKNGQQVTAPIKMKLMEAKPLMRPVRLWTLGKLEGVSGPLIPTSESIEKLRSLIESGTTDIIWGPDLDCKYLARGEDKILIPVEKLENGEYLYQLKEIKEDA